MLGLFPTIFICISITLGLKQNNNILSDQITSKVLSGTQKITFDTHYIDDNTTVLPDSFDAREQWINCQTIGQVWDQGACSSGWAISAVSVLSDRVCIQSNQSENPVLSPEDLLSCCSRCRFDCQGGYPSFSWEYFNKYGITTGGAYGSNTGCKSYTIPPCGHYNESSQSTLCSNTEQASITTCEKTCDSDGQGNYDDNLYYTQEPYRVYPLERQIKLEIMQNGPVQATINVWEDLLNYKTGVHVANAESDFLGEQSVKLIGWGIDENGQSYWLAVNSWNTDWGDNGLFKWLVNQTENAMETQVYAAVPYSPKK